jgi:hypothetical protein
MGERVINRAIELVAGAKRSLPESWALGPEDLMPLRMLGVRRLGEQLIAAALFLLDMLMTNLQGNGCSQFGIDGRASSLD